MYVETYKYTPLRKRVPTVIDRTKGIQRYGVDNLYPQRMSDIADFSYTAGSAVEGLSSFLFGKGFVDPSLGELVINSDGDTLTDLLKYISIDRAMFNGYALHVSLNAFMQPAEVNWIDFPFVRFGLPDEYGLPHDYKVNTNWERDPNKNLTNTEIIDEYGIFTQDKFVIEQLLEKYQSDFGGMVLYSTPKRFVYPKCTFDRVSDHAQIQEESAVFDLSSMQNGFTATTIFKYPGKFENDEQKRDLNNKLNPFTGSRGAKSTIVVENPAGMSGEDVKLTESIQMQNTDRMFEAADQRAKKAIRENFRMPMEILGVSPETGMFNKEQITEAFTYYNFVTNEARLGISRDLKKVLSNFQGMDLSKVSFEINKAQYV
jgi:hypothetical protein